MLFSYTCVLSLSLSLVLSPRPSLICASCLVCCSWVQSGPLQASSASSGLSPPSLCSKYLRQPHTFLNGTVRPKTRTCEHLPVCSTNTHEPLKLLWGPMCHVTDVFHLLAVCTQHALCRVYSPFYSIITSEGLFTRRWRAGDVSLRCICVDFHVCI